MRANTQVRPAKKLKQIGQWYGCASEASSLRAMGSSRAKVSADGRKLSRRLMSWGATRLSTGAETWLTLPQHGSGSRSGFRRKLKKRRPSDAMGIPSELGLPGSENATPSPVRPGSAALPLPGAFSLRALALAKFQFCFPTANTAQDPTAQVTVHFRELVRLDGFERGLPEIWASLLSRVKLSTRRVDFDRSKFSKGKGCKRARGHRARSNKSKSRQHTHELQED